MKLFTLNQLLEVFAQGPRDLKHDEFQMFLMAGVLNHAVENDLKGVLFAIAEGRDRDTAKKYPIIGFTAELDQSDRQRGRDEHIAACIVAQVEGVDIYGELNIIGRHKRDSGRIRIQGATPTDVRGGGHEYTLPDMQKMLLATKVMELEALFAEIAMMNHGRSVSLEPKKLVQNGIYYISSGASELLPWAVGEPVRVITQIDFVHIDKDGDVCDCLVYENGMRGREQRWMHSSNLYTQSEMLFYNLNDNRNKRSGTPPERPEASEFLDGVIVEYQKAKQAYDEAKKSKETQGA